MVSIALKISRELKEKINKLPWINWSEIGREEIIGDIAKSEKMEKVLKIISKSKLTEKNALEISRKINKSLHEKYKKKHKEAY